MKKLSILAILLSALVAVGTTDTVSAAAYLKFDGVDGEATDNEHKDWIIIESVSSPLHQPGGGTGATRRRGDVVLEDIQLTKTVDKASPKLAEAVCKGKVFPKVEIHVTASNTDAGRQTYHAYELTNVRVTSYSVNAGGSGSSGDVPVEEFSLNFEEVKVTYDKTRGKGKPKGNAETTWKVEKGEK